MCLSPSHIDIKHFYLKDAVTFLQSDTKYQCYGFAFEKPSNSTMAHDENDDDSQQAVAANEREEQASFGDIPADLASRNRKSSAISANTRRIRPQEENVATVPSRDRQVSEFRFLILGPGRKFKRFRFFAMVSRLKKDLSRW